MPSSLVVLLPGGKDASAAPFRTWQLASLRMIWLGLALRVRLAPTVSIRRIRYRVRGWNGSQRDPVTDAQAAIDSLIAEYPAARLVLVGHSMGGRVAAHCAARPQVAGIVALAPWWPTDDAVLIPTGTPLTAIHGTADTWTDPSASQRQCQAAVRRGQDACWVPMNGCGHFMVRHARRWHRLTTRAVRSCLTEPAVPTGGDPSAPPGR